MGVRLSPALMSIAPETLALGSALFGALAQIATKGSVGSIPPWLYLSVRWVVSVSAMLAISVILDLWPTFVWNDTIIFAIAGAVLGPLLSWNLYTRAVSRLDVSVAYSITQLSILISIAIAVIWLGEQPRVITVAGAMTVVAGVMLVQVRPDRGGTHAVNVLGVALAVGTAICWGLNGPCGSSACET